MKKLIAFFSVTFNDLWNLSKLFLFFGYSLMRMNQIRLAKAEMFTLPKKPHVSLNIRCDMLALKYIQVELNSNLKCVYFYIHYTSFQEAWHQ